MDLTELGSLDGNPTDLGLLGLPEPLDISPFKQRTAGSFTPSLRGFGIAQNFQPLSSSPILYSSADRPLIRAAVDFGEFTVGNYQIQGWQPSGNTDYRLNWNPNTALNTQATAPNTDLLTGAPEPVLDNSDPVVYAYDQLAAANSEVGQESETVAQNESAQNFSVAANTIKADRLWQGGELGLNLSGAGLAVGIWDGQGVTWQVQDEHQEFNGRVKIIERTNPPGGIPNDHATIVAGLIGAAGLDPQARGMANQVEMYSYQSVNYLRDMEAEGAKFVVSNHSFDPAFIFPHDYGKYNQSAQKIDEILYKNPKLLSVWGAGNDQRKVVPPGYDSLPPTQVAKNTLVVGAIEGITGKKETYEKSDVVMTDFSSLGPADDGRMKPDVVAAGSNLYAPVAFVPGSIPPAESNESYQGNLSGTSFAAPTVTGTAVLLIEHYRNLFGTLPLSATTKGLLTHTAFDAGNVGPDYSHGWGLVDAAAAANFLTDAKTSNNPSNLVMENSYGGNEWTMKVTSDGSSPLKATIVWTDPAPAPTSLTNLGVLNDRKPALVNNLDVWVTGPDGQTIYHPWTLDPANPANSATRTKKNQVDNVEQVLIDAPAPGDYTIHIGHTGNPFTQPYSLLVSGVKTGVSITPTDPYAYEFGDPGEFTVTRTGSTAKPLTVNYTLDGTATNGGDYQSLDGSVTIPEGQTEAKISLTPLDDTSVEDYETVVAKLQSSDFYYFDNSSESALMTIYDDDYDDGGGGGGGDGGGGGGGYGFAYSGGGYGYGDLE